jgi:hypothetical protein
MGDFSKDAGQRSEQRRPRPPPTPSASVALTSSESRSSCCRIEDPVRGCRSELSPGSASVDEVATTPDTVAPALYLSVGSGDCSDNWHESDFYRLMHFSAPAPLQKPRRNRCALDLVRARGRHGLVILHLGHPGHRSWYPDSINACQCLNRAEKIPVPYMLEA